MAKAAEAVKDSTRRRFEFVGAAEIPLSNIHPNPMNPRPEFHFGDENDDIKSLADSIRQDGLHNPVKVYEKVGHYAEQDAPGHFTLVQGHRRREATQLAGLDVLDCIVVRAPRNLQEELEMLGSEDAHKSEWPQLYKLSHAWRLASEAGLDTCASSEMQAKTGLSMKQLRIADKIQHLELPILAMVKEYEECRYHLLQSGDRKPRGRIGRGSGVNTLEFSVDKAALVWDIYNALKEKYPVAVRGYSDLELQRAVAHLVADTTIENGESFLSTIKATAQRPIAGVLVRIHDMLQNPHQRDAVKSFLRGAGSTHTTRFARLIRKIEQVDKEAQLLSRNIGAIGNDVDLLRQGNMGLLALLRHCDTLQQRVDKELKSAQKEQS